jgi:hypothetical protein
MCRGGGRELPRERADADLTAQFCATLVGVGQRGLQPPGARALACRVRVPHLADRVTGQEQTPLHGDRDQLRVISLLGHAHSRGERSPGAW